MTTTTFIGDFVLVDVREPNERDIVQIPGSISMPVGQFRSGAALALLPTDRPIVLHCKAGSRSAEALEILRAAGHVGARHLDGGVLPWVAEVDPSLPIY
jgi:rhodanese-related sulfurtransferase